MAILAVVKDPGGTNGVLPVVRELRQSGFEVHLVGNGKAVEILSLANEPFTAAESAEEILNRFGRPEALITSMCSQGGIGRDLVPLLRGQCPTFALQDFWGARLLTDWADLKYRPDYICVNDTVGVALAARAWPDFSPNRILTTGYPAIDRYANFSVPAVAEKARALLGIVSYRPVVLYAGIVKRAGDILAEVVAAVNDLNVEVTFIPRMHPRMPDDAPEELPKWYKALADFKNGYICADSSACNLQSLIACANVVLSAYSTTLVDAAALRIANISVLYPEVGMARFLEETGGLMKEFPLVELGCSAKAACRDELRALLSQAIRGELGLVAAQQKHFQLDGQNARRVAWHLKDCILMSG